MKFSQKFLYLFEQLEMLEKGIVKQSFEQYKEAFGGEKSISIGNPNFVKVTMYEHFVHYEGPTIARYMIINQLYSLFERYSISFSKDISKMEALISIADLNGSQSFKGIKTYYTKVKDINYASWDKIDTLRQVRNLVAHSDGYVMYSDQKNKIERLAKQHPNLKILSDGRLAVNRQFLKESMRAVMEFFDIVEPLVAEPDSLLSFGYNHVNEFIEFSGEKET
ncbi:hypothetical protein V6957_004767 [Vibrio parahaemolyticus]|uniref:hypothetical protein n=3 Tax=Vibrio parahaemolyticus TaxID=670 RepID=UPI000946D3E2|nr:hypothetical protein [Vibrio parahaemolyticus]EGQ8957095.1 hypothetical protein [Vibrio parahaemolyticus]EGQ8991476.1 hypothetical protein [Vibrio parahaemolyticus]EGQ9010648.1 hypothetical protein [Vibrio parahaemolyticus]EGR2869998.1 hypothetical protein [Vibrio parahaemolyticus]EGR2899727.1 hypothetical protein [Vibrio parahaemolyticus]